MCNWAFARMLISLPSYSCDPYTQQVMLVKGCEILKCHGLPVLCRTHLLEVGSIQNPVDHKTSSIACHVGLHLGLSSIQTWSLRPSSSSEVGQSWHFPPMGDFSCQ